MNSVNFNNLVIESSNPEERTTQAITPENLRLTLHPALARLATTLETRNEEEITNYSRMHNRHNRSHTRK